MIDRQKILKDIDGRLEKLDRELERLRSTVESSADSARSEARRRYEELRTRREELGSTLESYRDTGKAVGRELAKGFRRSLEEFKKGLAEAGKAAEGEAHEDDPPA